MPSDYTAETPLIFGDEEVPDVHMLHALYGDDTGPGGGGPSVDDLVDDRDDHDPYDDPPMNWMPEADDHDACSCDDCADGEPVHRDAWLWSGGRTPSDPGKSCDCCGKPTRSDDDLCAVCAEAIDTVMWPRGSVLTGLLP